MKLATRSAAAALLQNAAGVSRRWPPLTRAACLAARWSGCPSQGFRLASPSVRPASSRGRSWTGGPGARTRHNRN